MEIKSAIVEWKLEIVDGLDRCQMDHHEVMRVRAKGSNRAWIFTVDTFETHRNRRVESQVRLPSLLRPCSATFIPPSIWIRFYPRKSLGHDALNEYLRCADRSWYPEATIGRNVSINNNGRSLRGIPGEGGRWVWNRRQPRHQDGDAGDNAVSVVARRKRRFTFVRITRRFFAQVTMHFDEKEAKPAVESMGYRSGWAGCVFRNSLFACSKGRGNCLWSVLLIHGGWIGEDEFEKVEVFLGKGEGGREGLKDFWILPIRSYNPRIFESGRV